MKKILLFSTLLLVSCASHQPGQPVAFNQTMQNEKQAILTTLHQELKHRHLPDGALSVHYLKVKNQWAYIETTGVGDPGINAVLFKNHGSWTLPHAATACVSICPNGMTDCADGELICQTTLHQRFPLAPMEIWPSANAHNILFN